MSHVFHELVSQTVSYLWVFHVKDVKGEIGARGFGVGGDRQRDHRRRSEDEGTQCRRTVHDGFHKVMSLSRSRRERESCNVRGP